ncbi:MAG: hypothetical protein ACAI38_13250 [Myxococcota bacterium]|nr:hypothetical protein [Myxococcota bacterium]
MQSPGEAQAPQAPPSIEAATARKVTVPSREHFLALIAEAAQLGTVTLESYPRFDQLLYYLIDANVFGKHYAKEAGLTVSPAEERDAPTKMSVKAVNGGYDVTMVRLFEVGDRLPYEKTSDATVRLTETGGQVTIGRERKVAANEEAAKAKPWLPILGALGALRAIVSKIFGRD